MKRKLAGLLVCALCLTLSACASSATAVYVQSVERLAAMGGIAPGNRFLGMVVSEHTAEINRAADKTIAELLVQAGDAHLLLLRRPDGCTMGPSMVGLEASSVNKLYDRLSKRTDYREAGVLRDTDFDARRLFQLYDPSNNVVEIYAYLRNVREEILMH